MSGFISYIISVRGKVLGRLYGQGLTIAANCLNIPIPVSEWYLHLTFPFEITNAELNWVWACIHQYPLPIISTSDLTNAFRVMASLGIPFSSPLWKRWLDTLNVQATNFGGVERDILTGIPSLPHRWFDDNFIRKYDATVSPPVGGLPQLAAMWKYKRLKNTSEVFGAARLGNILDRVIRISANRSGGTTPDNNVLVYIDGTLMTSGLVTDRTITSRNGRLRRARTSARQYQWVHVVDGRPADVQIYDTKALSDINRIEDTRLAPRTKEIFQVLHRGARYLTPFLVGKNNLVIYGGRWMMEHISAYLQTLVLTGEKVDAFLSSNNLTSEVWNVWAVLNGALLVKPNDPFAAWRLFSFFGVPLANPSVLVTLSGMVKAALKNPSLVKEVATYLQRVSPSRELDMFHAEGDLASPAERVMYLAEGVPGLILSYPYVEYTFLSIEESAAERVGPGTVRTGVIFRKSVYVRLYEAKGEGKGGYPTYDEITDIAIHHPLPHIPDFATVSTNKYFLTRKGGIWYRAPVEVEHPTEAQSKVMVFPPTFLSRG